MNPENSGELESIIGHCSLRDYNCFVYSFTERIKFNSRIHKETRKKGNIILRRNERKMPLSKCIAGQGCGY